MRMILLGPPGAGKGSQAHNLSTALHLPHISTGDIFRANIKEGTPLGRKVKDIIDSGALVPDDLTVSIVADRLEKPDCAALIRGAGNVGSEGHRCHGQSFSNSKR